ncbi:uncharacterized protein [Dendropsophus ebraccatus]|uniref:uncharacterized protein n=1 Tax=Dendropsophus ebraccatus TaxID=150705 RepID=UPI003831290B
MSPTPIENDGSIHSLWASDSSQTCARRASDGDISVTGPAPGTGLGEMGMQLYGSYLWTRGYASVLTIRCFSILYLVKGMGCDPFIIQTMTRNNSYYMNGYILCLKCPAGNFVKKDCVIPNTQGICRMCIPGVTYSEYETGLDRCLTCTRCRADQEELSPCNITKNTICQCKNGTYCPMDSPCNRCLPCNSSCPEGQVLYQPCNTTSDIVCVPVTTSLTARTWFIPVLIIFAIVGTAVFLFLLFLAVHYRLSREAAGNCRKDFMKAKLCFLNPHGRNSTIDSPQTPGSLLNNKGCNAHEDECADAERVLKQAKPVEWLDTAVLQQVIVDVRQSPRLSMDSPMLRGLHSGRGCTGVIHGVMSSQETLCIGKWGAVDCKYATKEVEDKADIRIV